MLLGGEKKTSANHCTQGIISRLEMTEEIMKLKIKFII